MAVHPLACYSTQTLVKALIISDSHGWYSYYQGGRIQTDELIDENGFISGGLGNVFAKAGKNSLFLWTQSDGEFIEKFFTQVTSFSLLRGVVDRWIYPIASSLRENPERFIVGVNRFESQTRVYSNKVKEFQFCVNAETRQVFFQGVSRSLPQFEALAQWVREYDHNNHPFGPWELITERI